MGTDWEVRQVRFSPDATWLVVVSDDEIPASLWDVGAGSRVAYLDAHPYLGTGIAFSPDSQLVAIAGADSAVRVWTRDGRPVETLQGHPLRATGVAFSPSGTMPLTADGAGTIRLWDWARGVILHSFEALDDADRALRRRDRRGAHPRHTGSGAGGVSLYSLALAPDGFLLAVSCLSVAGLLQVWDLDLRGLGARRRVTLLDPRGRDFVSALRFSPDGRYLAALVDTWVSPSIRQRVSTPESRVIVLDARTHETILTIQSPYRWWNQRLLQDIAFSPDGRYLAVAHEHLRDIHDQPDEGLADLGKVAIWDIERRRPVASVAAHPDPGDAQVWSICSVDWASSGNLIATGGWDPILDTPEFADALVAKIWDIRIG